MKQKVDSIHFQYFNPFLLSFSWQIIHLKHFEGEGGLRRYVLYTQLDVDNYGWLLRVLQVVSYCIPVGKRTIIWPKCGNNTKRESASMAI